MSGAGILLRRLGASGVSRTRRPSAAKNPRDLSPLCAARSVPGTLRGGLLTNDESSGESEIGQRRTARGNGVKLAPLTHWPQEPLQSPAFRGDAVSVARTAECLECLVRPLKSGAPVSAEPPQPVATARSPLRPQTPCLSIFATLQSALTPFPFPDSHLRRLAPAADPSSQ